MARKEKTVKAPKEKPSKVARTKATKTTKPKSEAGQNGQALSRPCRTAQLRGRLSGTALSRAA